MNSKGDTSINGKYSLMLGMNKVYIVALEDIAINVVSSQLIAVHLSTIT